MAIKKTMAGALAFVTEYGNMSIEDLATFTAEFCEAKGRSETSGEPREIVRLYDKFGITIARRCSIFKVWLTPDMFNGNIENMSVCREANKLKTANLRKSEAMVRGGEAIRLEAKELTDIEDKLAKFEEYDAILEDAKTIKSAAIEIDDVPESADELFTYFETIEEIAESLGVEVITEKPKAETEV